MELPRGDPLPNLMHSEGGSEVLLP
jgi:hypothetical protein